MIYGTKSASLYDADCIVELDGDVYLGRLRAAYNRQGVQGQNIMSLPIWQIEKISGEGGKVDKSVWMKLQGATPAEIQASEDNSQKEYAITLRMYPDGREDYEFRMDICASYNYDFRR